MLKILLSCIFLDKLYTSKAAECEVNPLKACKCLLSCNIFGGDTSKCKDDAEPQELATVVDTAVQSATVISSNSLVGETEPTEECATVKTEGECNEQKPSCLWDKTLPDKPKMCHRGMCLGMACVIKCAVQRNCLTKEIKEKCKKVKADIGGSCDMHCDSSRLLQPLAGLLVLLLLLQVDH
eukprot:gnl/MRDRNA2_/MRDRNA2_102714_c0_seq1.p1 gnl/MRDRNA2_/MRDRNA2_102714_c0~~gnl/MRDRNA2_/MRDRNA2_102714_c0_seq1.p1  ORF type:complete len:181 (-),score=33.31 gnl/MRDRNA2_/MRDRNA2_102714_c0_seq1:102-644(-)